MRPSRVFLAAVFLLLTLNATAQSRPPFEVKLPSLGTSPVRTPETPAPFARASTSASLPIKAVVVLVSTTTPTPAPRPAPVTPTPTPPGAPSPWPPTRCERC